MQQAHSRNLTQLNKDYTYTKTFVAIYSSFICNWPQLEISEIFGEENNKLRYICTVKYS